MIDQNGQTLNTLKAFFLAQLCFSYTPSLKPFPNIHYFLLPLCRRWGRACAVSREILACILTTELLLFEKLWSKNQYIIHSQLICCEDVCCSAKKYLHSSFCIVMLCFNWDGSMSQWNMMIKETISIWRVDTSYHLALFSVFRFRARTVQRLMLCNSFSMSFYAKANIKQIIYERHKSFWN